MRVRRARTVVEFAAWIGGVAFLGVAAGQYVEGVNAQREAMHRFAALKARAAQGAVSVDVTQWSAARIKAWQSTRQLPAPMPLAILRIPRIGLEVLVLEGTDDLTLNRGVGHIEDTAAPGSDGNAGIAGHRDGFFRGLKDIAPGDVIELETTRATESYRIERTWIVNPDDVSVLEPTPSPSITLITCYPFYFVGPAPRRYIVRARRVDSSFTPL